MKRILTLICRPLLIGNKATEGYGIVDSHDDVLRNLMLPLVESGINPEIIDGLEEKMRELGKDLVFTHGK